MKNAKLILSVLLAFICGCSSQKTPLKDLYLLEVARPGTSELVGGRGVCVNNFQTAEAFDTKKFVYRTAENKYEIDYYREFLVKNGMMLSQMTSDWLEKSGVDICRSNETADFIVDGFVKEFYADFTSVQEPVAIITLKIFIRDRKGNPLFSKSYSSSATIEQKNADKVIDAFENVSYNLLADIEKDIAKVISGKG